jgi:DNA-binding MarR family transcriptional regulator/GNAT superfamily N-acetyltransferase
MRTSIAELRSFNRFYTRHIGLLGEHLTGSSFSLAEARILYELANGTAETAAGLSRILGMDKAYLSRLLSRFRSRGLISSRVSPNHAKHRILSLTEAGHKAFAALDKHAVAQMEELLLPLDAASAGQLTGAMRQIRSLLTDRAGVPVRAFTLRPPRVGDLGFVVHRQALLYEREYGWDWTYEALIAGIVERFVYNFDPAKEQAWIADRDGAIAGSVFLMRGDDPESAKLRLLYVEPCARGLGIGSALVAACINRAREAGYRWLTLWTNDILVSARRIYQATGFQLISEDRHHSFGHDLVGQSWRLELRMA